MQVVVVGAGIVGLATAYHLHRGGAEVTVLDRSGVAGGASWGNAGWVCPGLVAPLAEPGGWRHGLRALTDANAPLAVPKLTPEVADFLARFAGQMTPRRFAASIAANAELTREAIPAFERLASAGVSAPLIRADYVIGADSEATVEAFRKEVGQISAAGVDVGVRDASASEFPYFSDRVKHALTITGQAYIDPGAYCADLARVVREAGVDLREGVEVASGHSGTSRISLIDARGESYTADAVVVAAGAWSNQVLGRVFGAGTRIRQTSGRGYSFTVEVDPGHLPAGPVYLPEQRTVLTPYRTGVRVAGTMEFLPPDAPLRPERITSISSALAPFVEGLDLGNSTDHWVGPRPVSPNSRPILDRVDDRGYVVSGHGMWGLVLGPITGERIAGRVLEDARRTS
ncbi:D-amino acid dehydrogenase [Brevibacterium daeguense]|uniref:D-amino acid dehydrogenase n=1 Tax=Brevibacterium daeguense TaxID=909936 RepID=A0ABP8EIA2_9MICO|nr:FAD-dependent oxidoreductase [Brevibacterium daeguense]